MKKEVLIFGILMLIVAFFFDPEIVDAVSFLRNNMLTTLMSIVTSVILMFLILFAYFLLLKDSKKRHLLIISVVVTYIITVALKLIIMRERPDAALLNFSGYSFPSSHAAVAFSSFAIMNREFSGFKMVFFIIAFVIAFSRIYFGAHYASDLIAGGFLGYGIGYIILNRKAVIKNIKKIFK